MAREAEKRNEDREVPVEKKLDDLYGLIEGIETCMLTTRRPDGQLVSRAMQVQKRKDGTADLWFMTSSDTHKLDELETDPHVNCAFYKDGTREWISVSGTARVSQDRDTIHELYQADWRAWLGDEGGAKDGSADDPRIVLIFVEAQSVTYLKKDRPTPVILFSIAKAMVTGTPPKAGDLRHVGDRELDHGVARETR